MGGIIEQNWQEVFGSIQENPVKAQDFETAELFELVRSLAKAHRFQDRLFIAEQIKVHPAVSIHDLVGVEIIRGDTIRRGNNPEAGLNHLLPLDPKGFFWKAQRLQALGQCYLGMKRLHDAFIVQGQLVELIEQDTTRDIAADLRAYYLQSWSEMAIQLGRYDEAVVGIIEELVGQIPPGSSRDYNLAMLAAAKGRIALAKKDYAQAEKDFARYRELSTTDRTRAVADILLLYAMWMQDEYRADESVDWLVADLMKKKYLLQGDDATNTELAYGYIMQKVGRLG